MVRLTFFLLLAILSPLPSPGQAPASPRPPLRVIRYEENWRYLADPAQRNSFVDRFKWIRLAPQVHFSWGGDVRQRFESFRNEDWLESQRKWDPFHLQRYMLHGELVLGTRIRLFGQLKSGLQYGRDLASRPIDENTLDLHQAFVEVSLGQSPGALIRLGRQEVNLGSARLVAIREGPNVRFSLDGARIILPRFGWQWNLLLLRPARTRPGIFDDEPEHRQSLWGLYLTRPLPAAIHSSLDLYYLGFDRKQARFHSGFGREQRHSLGGRFFGRRAGWDWDYEALAQFGRFGSGSILAWTAGTNTGYRFENLRGKPRLGLKADLASGDRNPLDQRLGTFNALFPKGNYFSQADLLGPYNLMDLHPGISIEVHPRVTLNHDVDIFWRASTRDGLYDVPGRPIIAPGNSRARYIGHGVNFGFEWKLSRFLTVEGEYQRLLPGAFLRETGRSRTLEFVALWTTLRF